MTTRKNNINIIIVQRSWGGSEESPNETTTVPSYVRTYEYIMVPLGFGTERAQMKRKTRHQCFPIKFLWSSLFIMLLCW